MLISSKTLKLAGDYRLFFNGGKLLRANQGTSQEPVRMQQAAPILIVDKFLITYNFSRLA